MRLAWINEKGGTLKTTLATHSAVYLAAFMGEPTLLIDMDPQGQAGKCLGFTADGSDATTRDVLAGETKIAQAAIATGIDGLQLLRSDKSLALGSDQLARRSDGHKILRSALAGQRQWAHVVIDSPPSIGFLTRNILAAATDVCIPVNLSYLSLDGAAELVRTVEQAREELDNRSLRVFRVVPTLYRQTRLAQAVLDKLQENFGSRCANTRIGISVKVDEAQSWGQTIWEYAPSSPAAENFLMLMTELFGAPRRDGYAILRARKRQG